MIVQPGSDVMIRVKHPSTKEPIFIGKVITLHSDGRLLDVEAFPTETEPATTLQGKKERAVRSILELIGEDVGREGLQETPARVVKSWEKLFGGYSQDPAEVFKTFDGEQYDGLVLLKDIEFFSTCEHHMIPFHGVAHIGYIPNGKIIGISKLARLLEIYARRLQVQERICSDITSDLMTYLQPKGAACVIEATHLCMTARGVEKATARTVTSSLAGVFKTDVHARAEFMSLIK